MSGWLRRISMAMLVSGLALAGCTRDPINSPYETGALAENTLYTAFVKRSPKYLDPARSYSTDETPYTYNIYEPLYGYQYLKRPYELIPSAAAAISPPRYLDAQGHELPPDTPGQSSEEHTSELQSLM